MYHGEDAQWEEELAGEWSEGGRGTITVWDYYSRRCEEEMKKQEWLKSKAMAPDAWERCKKKQEGAGEMGGEEEDDRDWFWEVGRKGKWRSGRWGGMKVIAFEDCKYYLGGRGDDVLRPQWLTCLRICEKYERILRQYLPKKVLWKDCWRACRKYLKVRLKGRMSKHSWAMYEEQLKSRHDDRHGMMVTTLAGKLLGYLEMLNDEGYSVMLEGELLAILPKEMELWLHMNWKGCLKFLLRALEEMRKGQIKPLDDEGEEYVQEGTGWSQAPYWVGEGEASAAYDSGWAGEWEDEVIFGDEENDNQFGEEQMQRKLSMTQKSRGRKRDKEARVVSSNLLLEKFIDEYVGKPRKGATFTECWKASRNYLRRYFRERTGESQKREIRRLARRYRREQGNVVASSTEESSTTSITLDREEGSKDGSRRTRRKRVEDGFGGKLKRKIRRKKAPRKGNRRIPAVVKRDWSEFGKSPFTRANPHKSKDFPAMLEVRDLKKQYMKLYAESFKMRVCSNDLGQSLNWRPVNNWTVYLFIAKRDFELCAERVKRWTEDKQDFQFIKVIGGCPTARIVLGRNKKTGFFYGIKVVPKSFLVKSRLVHQLYREKELLECLHFPFTVMLESFFQDEVNLFFALPLALGGTLYGLLKVKGKFDEDMANFYAAQVLLALEYLHHIGVVFRDLRPENVDISHDGYIRLRDFTLAKVTGGKRTYTLCGTPEYMAPEVLAKEGHDRRADWWSYGVLLYEMCAGRSPFSSQNPLAVYKRALEGDYAMPEDLTNPLAHLIAGFLQTNPTKRFGCTDEYNVDYLKRHPWFEEVDWLKVLNMKVRPIYVPDVRDPYDTRNLEPVKESPLYHSSKNKYSTIFSDF